MLIPAGILKKLYTPSSLKNTGEGPQFSIKNRLIDAEVVSVGSIVIDGRPVALDHVWFDLADGRALTPAEIDSTHPVPFPFSAVVTVRTDQPELPIGQHDIDVAFETRPFGRLSFRVQDTISESGPCGRRIPRDDADDYHPEIIKKRQKLIQRTSGVKLRHLTKYSFDPHLARGNCENFTGVAQVPMGFAGPILVHGEHAEGEFLIPLATSEGTLVASYNRGMKVLNLCRGVKVTVLADAMQRAPVFVFQDARACRDFVNWIEANLPQIRRKAEATSTVAKLLHIDPYLANKFVYLRFNFSTGDAAGQNMVGRATDGACCWILITTRESPIFIWNPTLRPTRRPRT